MARRSKKSKSNPTMLIGLALGGVGLYFLMSEKKASAATPQPVTPSVKTPPGPTPPVKVDPPKVTPTPPTPDPSEYLPGTTTLKSRVRVIDATTPTPSQFAERWSGFASRWRELVAANPVGTIFPGSPAIKVVDILRAPEGGGERPTKVGEGLSPWNLGQLVHLPDSWKG